ncbi:MAG: hypothetical protein ABIP07_06585, partial [Sphingomicrobium sp.]
MPGAISIIHFLNVWQRRFALGSAATPAQRQLETCIYPTGRWPHRPRRPDRGALPYFRAAMSSHFTVISTTHTQLRPNSAFRRMTQLTSTAWRSSGGEMERTCGSSGNIALSSSIANSASCDYH